MELLEDGLLAFFSAVGLAGCIWLAAGALLGPRRRNPEVELVLPVWGDAPAMEADLRELVRARRNLGGVIVLEDRGLTEDASALAAYFCARYAFVRLRTDRPPEDASGEQTDKTAGAEEAPEERERT